MGAKAARTHIVQGTRLDGGGIDSLGEIRQPYFDTVADAPHLDDHFSAGLPAIGVTNDVLTGFVDGEDDVLDLIGTETAKLGRIPDLPAHFLQPACLGREGNLENSFAGNRTAGGVPRCPFRVVDGEIEVRTPTGTFRFDHVIAGTGPSVELEVRPELAELAPRIARWRDRYQAPDEWKDDALAEYPYLGSGFEFLPRDPAEDEIVRLRAAIADLIVGRPIRDGAHAIAERLASAGGDHRSPDDAVIDVIAMIVAEELDEFRQDRLVMAGTANLARRESDFRGSIYPLLEAIEEQVTLMRLMGEMVADEHGLAASIGRENEPFGLAEASVVAGEYDASGARARVGVLGPTRMDYPSNLASVRAVARYLSRLLEEDEGAR